MSPKQEHVLKYLGEHKGEAVSPTTIGLALGYPYNSASARVHDALWRLIQRGKVEWVSGGKYRLVQE